MDFEKEIKKILQQFVKNPILEVPPKQELGDYALPCFTLAKELKQNPFNIAKDIASKIKPSGAITKAVAVGPYVNFYINKAYLSEQTIKKISKEKGKYGTKNLNHKKIVLDFSSPNIAKPFGVGHLRSTVIGNAIKNLYQTQGYTCVSINHLGDWGTQFGKLIVAYKKWGDPKKLKKDPVKYLLHLYIKFHEQENEQLLEEARAWFKKLEDQDKEALKLWKTFKEISLKEFKTLYKRLNIKFDKYEGESSYNNQLKQTTILLDKEKLTEDDQGAKIIRLEGLTPALITKSDGSTLYLTRDIAAFLHRAKTYNPEKIVYVVGSEQSLHFAQLFKIMELLKIKTEGVHVPFGLFFLPEGKMSTRQGKIIFLEDVLNEVITLAKKTINEKNPKLKNKDKTAEDVGIGSVIFWDLAHDRIKDLIFDKERVLDFEGETGPYVQYTHARADSILRKAKSKGKSEYSKLSMPVEQKLASLMADYEKILEEATKHHKPSTLARYLIDLSQTFNEFYHSCNCINEPDKGLKNARLNLVAATAQVLKNGLGILGIKAPKEM